MAVLAEVPEPEYDDLAEYGAAVLATTAPEVFEDAAHLNVACPTCEAPQGTACHDGGSPRDSSHLARPDRAVVTRHRLMRATEPGQCPVCGAPPEDDCHDPDGAWRWWPHLSRLPEALHDLHPDRHLRPRRQRQVPEGSAA